MQLQWEYACMHVRGKNPEPSFCLINPLYNTVFCVCSFGQHCTGHWLSPLTPLGFIIFAGGHCSDLNKGL